MPDAVAGRFMVMEDNGAASFFIGTIPVSRIGIDYLQGLPICYIQWSKSLHVGSVQVRAVLTARVSDL